ncbi:glycine cleavage system protein GcvH [Halapricum desulfuricans]|uniref:Probable glycine cleavage system H protein n=1 Tax=Halapricum desulfuricans TaxID=2841257 RepID=A0A897NBM6_9EURY|nr:glycine cleavage system protein GcvH [Halapricum desulfuricans]QSG08815.1 Glycine cleavage system H protein (lipoate-binding) [Halapricum desulfuricans]QSG11763.1 Glycine cleavage system H protein (lipoate-binding) [Halapricum desulfuricans]
MSYDIPELLYLDSHEWIDTTDGTARIGISDVAQDELGDVVFVELPSTGDELSAGDDFAVVESIKAVSDVYAPVSGEVTAVNETLLDRPELLNDDPYGDGWLVEIELADPEELEALLSAEEYEASIET